MFRKVVTYCCLMGSILVSHGQTSINKEYSKYGFSFGINRSDLDFKSSPNISIAESKAAGIRLGILAEYKLFNRFYFSPKAELSFYDNELAVNKPNEINSSYTVLPIAVEFKGHLIYKIGNGNLKPYLLTGPSYLLAIDDSESKSNSTFNLDVGLGLERNFCIFLFSPEFRYSYGLQDVISSENWQSATLHNISLVLSFKG